MNKEAVAKKALLKDLRENYPDIAKTFNYNTVMNKNFKILHHLIETRKREYIMNKAASFIQRQYRNFVFRTFAL